MRDLANNILVKRALSSTRVTDNTAQVSQIIDRQGYDAVIFITNICTIADTDATFTALLEESDDSGFSTSNAVADTDLIGTEAAASFQFDDDNEVRKLGYIGNKRYLRYTITPANNTGNADIGLIAVLSTASLMPVTQTAS